MKPTVLGIVIVLALLAAGAIFYGGSAFAPAPQEPVSQSYVNDALGIAFTYPVGYLLSEGEIGNQERGHYVITLIREADAVPVVAGGEGPTAINLDFYQNDIALQSLNEWLLTEDSNFKLGDGTYASTSVDGTDALRYRWDGLYQGETTAFLHGKNIVAVSVTYMSPADDIYAAYEAVLSSLKLH